MRNALFGVAAALLWAAPGPASAAFTICNRSFDVANVAIGRDERGTVETRGWWKIGPNQCAEVIPDRLRGGPVHVFALDVFGRTLLSGSVPLCVAPGRFVIEGAAADCAVRGHLDARFLLVDTGAAEAWRLFLAPIPE
ncbi:DUF1036 domain-containing protein [Jannaschia sp. Os4]|uniref:DUF1036 domain-containing protein n=1 Tax=Jannaschia sp. Os4 TaxID=2807617 RepID=UPI00193AC2C2|nr:DUF1036 domain-containing protein [Jannaschia sp. Os4]MBM2578065.1 DUF1036 domain-containing protein [Jannaschia sp. Os4]